MSEKGEGLVGRLRDAAMALERQAANGAFPRPTPTASLLRHSADRIEALSAKLKLAEAALEGSEQALCDWLNTYAPDLCDPNRVAEAEQRIGEQGTIAYIASVLAPVRAALSEQSNG